jgi:hypothetical protein
MRFCGASCKRLQARSAFLAPFSRGSGSTTSFVRFGHDERTQACIQPVSERPQRLLSSDDNEGEPCRRKALDADGLCLVHNGSQDMRALGRLGGRATPKAKRANVQRESLREFLRREVDPARVWAAIEAGLESGNDRDRLAASKLLLTELYEPAAVRQREEAAEVARARERVLHRMDEISRRRVLAGLIECGLIRPGGGKQFEGVVMFNMHELAEWVGNWAPRPVTVTDIACATCGKGRMNGYGSQSPTSATEFNAIQAAPASVCTSM